MLGEHPYLYCEHEPVNSVHPSGHILETIWDIGNVAYDIYTRDWGNLLLDGAAMLIPFVPAGAGKAVDLVKKIGKRFNSNQQALIDLAKWAKKIGGVTEEEADIMREWAKEYGLKGWKHKPHSGRRIDFPHIHIGPVDHIRIRK